jgi:hypothetical protein
MRGGRAPRRYPASAFPEIIGIRLAPVEATATLVNLSATGVLLECACRAVPGTQLTVHFEGTFVPPSIASRVIRCEVARIASDGSLRYHLGLAFGARLSLAVDAGDDVEEMVAAVPPSDMAALATGAPVLRNRW